MIHSDFPRQEGFYKSETLSAEEIRKLPPVKRVQMAHKLSELSSEFVFFNHGLLFTEANLTTDPVEEWMLKRDNSEAVFALIYDRPLFKGLDHFWNKTLYGCKIEFWPEIYNLLNGVIACCKVRQLVLSCFMHTAYIPDPNEWSSDPSLCSCPPRDWGINCENAERLAQGDMSFEGFSFPVSPTPFKIHVSGVSGPKRLAYIKSCLYPYVSFAPPEQETIQMQKVMVPVVN